MTPAPLLSSGPPVSPARRLGRRVRQELLSPAFRAGLGGALAFLLLGVGLTIWVGKLEEDRAAEHGRARLVATVAQLRSDLEHELVATLVLIQGLHAFVVTHPEAPDFEYREMAEELLRQGRHVRNVGLAPGDVLRHVVPLEGNEAAVGLRYRDDAAQWPAVERAIRTRSTVVAGPLKLAQGGVGLVARTPLFTRARPGAPERYWGLSSVVIDFDGLVVAAGLASHPDLEVALRGRDGTGEDGETFHGDPSLFEGDAVTSRVTLPGGSWQLAARPRGGFGGIDGRARVVRALGLGISVAFASLLGLVLHARRRNRDLALEDPLTHLPNRRLLVDRLEHSLKLARRHGHQSALVYLDLDAFKPVNDRHGHRAGDRVLVVVGERLREALRETDTVARLGGDEFAVVVEGPVQRADVEALARHLEAVVSEPIPPGRGFPELRVGASAGFALFPADGAGVDDLVNRADHEMYARKQARKDSRLAVPGISGMTASAEEA